MPSSVLWLKAPHNSAIVNLRREAKARGVSPDRIVFASRVPDPADHLARLRLADLFLDTFPYGAHTTTNDALLIGLPVLTCAGETLVTRLAGSQLHAIGLPELVTADFSDYEALALRLAREPETLAEFRTRLAHNRHTYPLYDMARYTQDFEDGLEAIWRSFLTQQTRMSSA